MTKKLCCNVTKFRQIVSTEKLQCYNSITQFFSWNQATMQKKLQTIILWILWILLQLQNRHKNWNSFISVSFLLPDLSIILVKSSIFAKDLSKSIHFLSQKVFFSSRPFRMTRLNLLITPFYDPQPTHQFLNWGHFLLTRFFPSDHRFFSSFFKKKKWHKVHFW